MYNQEGDKEEDKEEDKEDKEDKEEEEEEDKEEEIKKLEEKGLFTYHKSFPGMINGPNPNHKYWESEEYKRGIFPEVPEYRIIDYTDGSQEKIKIIGVCVGSFRYKEFTGDFIAPHILKIYEGAFERSKFNNRFEVSKNFEHLGVKAFANSKFRSFLPNTFSLRRAIRNGTQWGKEI